MGAQASIHESVLLHETIEGLSPKDGEVILDGTLGGGGHAAALLSRARITLIGLDLDTDALARALPRLEAAKGKGKVIVREANFRDLDTILDELGISKLNKALFDFGLSSDQLEVSGRGFSFTRDEPLSMTLSSREGQGLTAADIVNEWEEEAIANVLFGYGEERYARRIAKAIVRAREEKRIETSGELAQIVIEATPAAYRRGKTHPATRTFQALRIAANDELGSIREALPKAWARLASGGRIAAISFHSLEDRIVKHLFREFAAQGGILITKKPLIPSAEEASENPRARSAKLRIIEHH